MRDCWNILDILVVTLGWAGLIVDGANISVIRMVRVLRPLRTVNSIPELKLLVTTILTSLPLLMDIVLLFVFFLIIFGLTATQMYAGQFKNRCHLPDGTALDDFCYLD